MRFNRNAEFNRPFCKKPNRFRPTYITKIGSQISWTSAQSKRKSCESVCSDGEEILNQAQLDDFVHPDPLYAGRFTDYFNSWHDDDARRLEFRLKAPPCRFLYSMWSENKYRKNTRLHDAFSD